MKHRLLLSFILIASLLLLCGCSALFLRAAPPRQIVLRADTEAENDETAIRGQGAVVTVVTVGSFQVGLRFGSFIDYSSGVIVNEEGYVLAAASSLQPAIYTQDGEYIGTANAAYAVLSDVYLTSDTLYRLELVDVDAESGFALYSFYDSFSYAAEDFSDSEHSGTVEGFPIVAEFSSETIAVGDFCTAIGNAVGSVVNDTAQSLSSLSHFSVSATSGAISQTGDETFLIGAAVSPEMIGGAVFDQNGYCIGILSEKLRRDAAADQNFVANATLCSGVDRVLRYLDAVSASLRIPIPYTVASEVAA